MRFHSDWAWVAIISNGLAGLAALLSWRVPRLRGAWLWALVIAAEIAIMIQVVAGVVLVSASELEPPRFHMFYGFIAFLTVGIAYSYRASMRGRLEMLYGFAGLFLMGLGIRAMLTL